MSAEQGNVQPWRENVERVREALLKRIPKDANVQHPGRRQVAALDALTTQIENTENRLILTLDRAKDAEQQRNEYGRWGAAMTTQLEELEQERDDWEVQAAKRLVRAEAAEARAVKAERALADARLALDRISRSDHLIDAANTARVALRPSEDTSDE